MTIKPRLIPFKFGDPIKNPADFIGRREILQEIANALLNLQHISLRGERRTGKTSLLHYLAHHESAQKIGLPETHIPVYVNFQDFAEASVVNVWRAIADAIAQQLKQRNFAGQALSEQFLATVDEFLASSEAPELFGTGFGLAFAQLDEVGIKLNLLFDEFDQTVRNPDLGDPFYDALRSLPTRAENVSYVIATRTGLIALQPSYNKVSSPFFNIFSSLTLSPFQEDDTYHLIFDYCAGAGFDQSWPEKLWTESEFLFEVTGYHPFFLQVICYHLFEKLDKPDWPLGQAKEEALRDFREDSIAHFDQYWKVSSIEEQQLIRKLVADQPIDKTDRKTLAVLQELESRCLAIQDDNEWRLFSSIFGDWVVSVTPTISPVAPHTSAVLAPSSTIDFLIITTLEEVRYAILEKLPGHQKLSPSADDIRVYYSSNLPITFPDGSRGAYQIIVMSLLSIELIEATTATSDAIRHWNPRYAMFVGLSAGIAANNVKLGDVLVSSQIVDYELQKLTPEGLQVRWEIHRTDQRLVGAARTFSDTTWLEMLTTVRPNRGRPSHHVGPIVSGDTIIEPSEVLAKYSDQWPKFIGLEMEAVGPSVASLRQATQQPGLITVHGVSHFADVTEPNFAGADQWRLYACDAAASYAIALLKAGPVPLSAVGEGRKPRQESTTPEKQPQSRIDAHHRRASTDFPRTSEEESFMGSSKPEYKTIWQIETSLRPEHFFANSEFIYVVDKKGLHFFSTNDGERLLASLKTLGNFSREDYDIVGGAVSPYGNLLLTVLPRRWYEKAYLLALTLQPGQAQPSIEPFYEASGPLLSAPIIDGELIYLIQSRSELVVLDPEQGKVPTIISLPDSEDYSKDCVSLAVADNHLWLASCDGKIVSLEPRTGQALTTVYQEKNQLRLSPLATDGWWLFFGVSPQKELSVSRVEAIDVNSGRQKWTFELPSGPSGQPQSIKSQPLILKSIVCITAGKYLYALDIETGQELWHYEMPERIKLGPQWTGKSLIIIDRAGNIHAIEFGQPEFSVACHYDFRTPPTKEKWHPVTFTLANTGYRTADKVTLRLKTDEFKGKSEHHTQELFRIAPEESKQCMVNFAPMTSGSTVYIPVIIEYQTKNGLVNKQKIDINIPVRDSNLDPVFNEDRGLSPDGNQQYNFTALRALLLAALTDREIFGLCRNYFSPLSDTFERGLAKSELIRRLVEYVNQQGQVERLLSILQSRAPILYEQFIREIKVDLTN